MNKVEALYRWIRLNQEGITIYDLVKKYRCGQIALYGYNEISKLIFFELADTEINIPYFIDKNKSKIMGRYKCESIENALLDTSIDLIIVCISKDSMDIAKDIKNKTVTKVISFEELIYEL